MTKQDKLLYDYLIDNGSKLTDAWLSKRERVSGSIYSIDSGEKTEKMLREQNSFTLRVIASSLLPDEDKLQKNIDEWAKMVAESRVSSGTPIYEVVAAVNKYHGTIMEFIREYVKERGEEVSKEDLWRWNSRVSYALNELITRFTKLYHEITKEQLAVQQKLIDELSTPIIPISELVGVVPLIGTLDSDRAQKILGTLPEKCVQAQIEHLFIDLSGMPVVDTMVVHQVYQLIKILGLLGITSTISGIRPEVAQTAVQLGIDIKDVSTFGTLKQAISVTGISLEES